MEYIDLKDDLDYSKLDKCADIIKKGGLVIFPTETVYGIGANGLDNEAVLKIFEAKGRASDNPLILHIANLKMLDEIVLDICEIQKKLIEKFWPGPLTIIFKKKDIVPFRVTGGLDTVAVRMPSNKIALEFIKKAGVPIAAPSANISGRPSGTKLGDIKEEFFDKVEAMIDGGEANIGLESTVVMVDDNKIKILRPGGITKEDLLELGYPVLVDKNVLGKSDGPLLSPGMKYKHYAPKTNCILVFSEDEEVMINKIKLESKKYNSSLVLAKKRNVNNYDNVLDMGDTLEEISHNIFSKLREADKKNVDIIFIEGVKSEGLGLAIMNRLLRACSYNYIYL